MLRDYEKKALDRAKAKAKKGKAAASGGNAEAAGDQAGEGRSTNGKAAAADAKGNGQTVKRKKPTQVEAYFDQGGGNFWAMNQQNEWARFTPQMFNNLLAYENWNTARPENGGLSQAMRYMHQLVMTRSVHFAGELAGYKMGPTTICGHRVLITRGPKIRKPEKGPWDTIKRFLETLLGDQVDVFYTWLKGSLIAMRQGAPFREGQLLVVAGDGGCGKSLMQELLTHCLGGRQGNPFEFLTGGDKFTSDINRAEHLAMSDECLEHSPSARIKLKQKIKALLVNKRQRIRAMGGTPMQLAPYVRMTLTVNNEPENLAIIPPPDGDMTDKLILMLADQGEYPCFLDPKLDPRKQWEMFDVEIPPFLGFLQSFTPPSKLRDSKNRYYAASFKNPVLLSKLSGMQLEMKILDLIDTLDLHWTPENVFLGYPAAILDWIRRADKTSQLDRELYYGVAQLGQVLAKLAKTHPQRVQVCEEAHNKTLYVVYRDVAGMKDLAVRREAMEQAMREAKPRR